MAAWRKKAYSLFSLTPGSYSYAEGKRELLIDLVEWARAAIENGDIDRLNKIVDYVIWAAGQDSDELGSVVDLAFFLPVFRDPQLSIQRTSYFPKKLVAQKWKLLMENQA